MLAIDRLRVLIHRRMPDPQPRRDLLVRRPANKPASTCARRADGALFGFGTTAVSVGVSHFGFSTSWPYSSPPLR